MKSLERNPLLTKYFLIRACTGAGFCFAGDFISQVIIEKKIFEGKRSSIVTSYGFVETIAEGHFWLNFLEKAFGSHRNIKNALVKTAANIICFGPVEIALFIVWTNKLGDSPFSLREKMKNDYLIVLTNSFVFWLPASVITFYFIPMKLRPLFSCFSNVIWDTFMSFASHNSLSPE